MDHTRVDALLSEAAARLQGESDAEVLEEAAAILTAEHGRATVPDRLRRSGRVRLGLPHGDVVAGSVTGVGAQFVSLLADDDSEQWVRLGTVLWMSGLAGALAEEGVGPGAPVQAWGALVRSLGGQPVGVQLADGAWVRGLVAASGSDHLDLVGADGQLLTCPLSAITRLRRHRMDA